MFDPESFKKMLAERNIYAYSLAEALGIHEGTLSRKVRGDADWLLWEIQGVADICKLTDDELIRIFFYKEDHQ